MTQKEKLIASAQKFLAKGQTDRAVKDYEQAVSLDPGDQRTRQKLAELLVRTNRKDDAAREFGIIGKQYADNAFYLKAIAVYKQVQKLDPSNIEIALLLGDLNEKQGLKGNALAEYKMAVDYYERSGNVIDAGKVLDRMCSADPANANVRLKKAETLMKAGKHEDAYAEFISAALLLRRRNDRQGLSHVAGHLRTLFPERREFLLDVLERQLKDGEWESVSSDLEMFLQKNPSHRRGLLLLSSAWESAGRLPLQIAALKKAHEAYPADVAVGSFLISAILSAGETGEAATVAVSLLGTCSKESLPEVEKCFRLLHEHVPADPAVLHGLKAYYVRVNDAEKVADIEARLLLLQSEAPPSTGDADDVVDSSSALPDFGQDGGYYEETWEEEIDLSLEDDGLPLVVPESPEASVESSLPDEDQPLSGPGKFDDNPLDADVEVEEPDLEDEDIPVAPSFDELTFEDDEEASFALDSTEETAVPSELPAVDDTVPSPGLEGDSEGFAFTDLDVDGFSFFDDASLSHPGEAPAVDVEVPVFTLAAAEEAKTGTDSVRLDSQIDHDDTETHYNLGIAYKEMGLLGDAMVEFARASGDPQRRASCVALIGLCQRENGDLDGAVATFRKGLEEALQAEERATLAYELGVVLTMQGNKEEAAAWFRQALQAVPGFLDARPRIRALTGTEEGDDLLEPDLVDLDLEVEEAP